MASETWVVHKFGGTSVADAACLRNVRSIVAGLQQEDREGPAATKPKVAVVVSAMGGKPKVTDMLLDSVTASAAHEKATAKALIDALRAKHFEALEALTEIPEAVREAVRRGIVADLEDIGNLLRAVQVMRCASPQISELVSGYGETWSAQILAALLTATCAPFAYVDAKEVLRVRATEIPSECGAVAWDVSKAALRGRVASLAEGTQLVITGYIASTTDGAPTTLKRDGSDYSASIFGKLLVASEVHIWTDVDGVLSADPRRVPEAFSLEQVTYEEAMELAYFGAKVLHPKTMTPAVEQKIPLFIRNTFNPLAPGTRIGATCERVSMMAGFTTVDKVAVLNVMGRGMLGVPGVISKAAQALQRHSISVRLIAQASSEQSIALAIDANQATVATRALSEAFAHELREGSIAAIETVAPCSIIAAVSRHLDAQAPGRFYDALGRAGIKLVASAQGCDERNISAVVREADSRRALRCVHSAFLSHHVVAVALVGAGFVGSAFLAAIRDASDHLLTRFNVKLRVCAIVTADRMVLADASQIDRDSSAIDLENWPAALKASTRRASFGAFVDHLESYRAWVPNLVVVDTSYSVVCAEQHKTWLEHQFHVINANQRALAGPLDLFEAILRARDAAGRCLYCSEACVGGGVPIIDTLRNLVHGGDTIEHVDCVISASMSAIFSKVSPADAARGLTKNEPDPPRLGAFADALREAWVSGLLENEPLYDLSGQDTATKLLALGRELGLALEPQHVRSEPLPGVKDLLQARSTSSSSSLSSSSSSSSSSLRGRMTSGPLGDYQAHYASWRSGRRDDARDSIAGGSDYGSREMMRKSSSMNTLLSSGHHHHHHHQQPGNSDHHLQQSRAPSPDRPNIFGTRVDGRVEDDDYHLRVDQESPDSPGLALPIPADVVKLIDAAVHTKLEAAHAKGKVLRHVGRINVKTGEVTLKLEELDPTHAFAQLSGPELCVRFYTERYAATPLTVQGPLFSSGTASGLFAELLRVVRHCSGHDRPTHSILRRTPSMGAMEQLAALSVE